MTAIPDDVMNLARAITADYRERWEGVRSETKITDIWALEDEFHELAIARAFMAERRRCALLARQWKSSPHKDESFAANSIADQIMAGGK